MIFEYSLKFFCQKSRGVKNNLDPKILTKKKKFKTLLTATTFTTDHTQTVMSFTYTDPALANIYNQNIAEYESQIMRIAPTCRWS